MFIYLTFWNPIMQLGSWGRQKTFISEWNIFPLCCPWW